MDLNVCLADDYKKNSFESKSLRVVMINFAKGAVNDKLKGVIFYDHISVSEFLRGFDSSFNLSKQSLSNYKRRKLVFKPFIINKKIISFLSYVKRFFPLFDIQTFLYLCNVNIPKRKNTRYTRLPR